jgi:hypothetical protein
MSITVRWDDEDEKKIIRWEFPEMWVWDDFYGALQLSRALTREVKYVVDVLVDMSKAKMLPKNVLTQTQVTLQTSPLNIGVVVVVSINPLVRAAFNSFMRLYKNAMRSSSREIMIVSMEHKAYEIIAEYRAKRKEIIEE